MATYQTPGVYIEEISAGPRPIQASGTTSTAFVGVLQIPTEFRRGLGPYGNRRPGPGYEDALIPMMTGNAFATWSVARAYFPLASRALTDKKTAVILTDKVPHAATIDALAAGDAATTAYEGRRDAVKALILAGAGATADQIKAGVDTKAGLADALDRARLAIGMLNAAAADDVGKAGKALQDAWKVVVDAITPYGAAADGAAPRPPSWIRWPQRPTPR